MASQLRCSFCQKSYREAFPLVSGPATEGVSAAICFACAKEVMAVSDYMEAQPGGVEGHRAAWKIRSARVQAHAVSIYLESLEKERALTADELDTKQRIAVELERLGAE